MNTFANRAVIIATAILLSACSTVNTAREPLLHMEWIGRGSKRVVVLPGLLGSSGYWYGDHFEGLGAATTVLLVDPLAFGRSPSRSAVIRSGGVGTGSCRLCADHSVR